ncbi:hypothetical protein RND71_002992 [Anisodus tanguticus]|uniref:Uncharacterized protein n=1 Tax=Anisodus tanguticus TaxID=243964 RepID=A0AAE1SVU5_9SOLA|nr:hypothetical protein RND71_002992 [Anisodus tanguticus]
MITKKILALRFKDVFFPNKMTVDKEGKKMVTTQLMAMLIRMRNIEGLCKWGIAILFWLVEFLF